MCVTAVRRQSSKSDRWLLWGAMCLQRFAIITPDMTPEQRELQDYFLKVDESKSLKSNHELRAEEDELVF